MYIGGGGIGSGKILISFLKMKLGRLIKGKKVDEKVKFVLAGEYVVIFSNIKMYDKYKF